MADKVLIVEDEAKIARTVRLYLEQAGYQVVMIQDSALAMSAFRHERPDLIILDLMLPNVDGWEICKQICSESGVPIIMLTARSDLNGSRKTAWRFILIKQKVYILCCWRLPTSGLYRPHNRARRLFRQGEIACWPRPNPIGLYKITFH